MKIISLETPPSAAATAATVVTSVYIICPDEFDLSNINTYRRIAQEYRNITPTISIVEEEADDTEDEDKNVLATQLVFLEMNTTPPVYFFCTGQPHNTEQESFRAFLERYIKNNGLQYSLLKQGNGIPSDKSLNANTIEASRARITELLEAIITSSTEESQSAIEQLYLLNSVNLRLKNSSSDYFGFYMVEPLVILVDLAYKSSALTNFITNYVKHRIDKQDNITLLEVLKILNEFIQSYIPSNNPGEQNIIEQLIEVCDSADTPIPPKLKIKLAGTPYKRLISDLLRKINISCSDLNRTLDTINRRITEDLNDITAFKTAHCLISTTSSIGTDRRTRYYLYLHKFHPDITDVRFYKLISSCFNPEELNNFFRQILINLLIVPEGKTPKSHIQSSITDIIVLIGKLCPWMPKEIIDPADSNTRKQLLLALLIQAILHTNLTGIEAELTGHPIPAGSTYPTKEHTIQKAVVEIQDLLTDAYEAQTPTCLTTMFGTTPLEVSAQCTTIAAYLIPLIDFVLDNFIDNPRMDFGLEGGFAAVFLLATILTLLARASKNMLTDYGRAPTLYTSIKEDLIKNSSFLTKALCAPIFTGLMYLSQWLSGKPTEDNPITNYIAVSGIILMQYLAMATGIESGLSILRVLAEQIIREQQAKIYFHTRTTPAKSDSHTVLLEAEAIETATPNPWAIIPPLPIGMTRTILPGATAEMQLVVASAFAPRAAHTDTFYARPES